LNNIFIVLGAAKVPLPTFSCFCSYIFFPLCSK